jgi:hypothetical protein
MILGRGREGSEAFVGVGVAVLVEDDDMHALIGIGRDDNVRPQPAPTTGAAPRAAASFNKITPVNPALASRFQSLPLVGRVTEFRRSAKYALTAT